MANIYQATVPTSGSAGVKICDIPPGTTVIISAVENNADVFLGMNTAVTSANGYPLDAGGPTTITNPPWGTSFSLYGVAGTGTHVVGVITIPAR